MASLAAVVGRCRRPACRSALTSTAIRATRRHLHIFPVTKSSLLAPPGEVVLDYAVRQHDHRVYIKNTAPGWAKYGLQEEEIAQHIDGVRRCLGFPDHRVDVWLCSDATMGRYNAMQFTSPGIRAPRSSVHILRDAETLSPSHGPEHDRGNTTDGAVAGGLDGDDYSANRIGIGARVATEAEINAVGPYLGDLIICPSYIQRACMKDWKMDQDGMEFVFSPDEVGVNRAMSTLFTVRERLPLLLVHGLVHLIGYDHETQRQWDEMTAVEERVLRELGMVPEK